jgi:hypothetical protein
VWVSVPNRDYGMASIEVEVFCAIGIIYVVALATHGLYGIERVYVKKIHRI